MSDTTKIQWTDCSWSPWLGCSKVSEGCRFCYITTTTPFRTRRIKHGDPRVRTSKAYWQQPHRWNSECEVHPDYRSKVFPSLCDWLDDEVPIEWLADFLRLIRETPHLDWLLLTKRPENWSKRVAAAAMSIPGNVDGYDEMICMVGAWMKNPPNNVWIGVSVENQAMADRRIPELLKIPARVRFLSCEPLLGPIDLSKYFFKECDSRPICAFAPSKLGQIAWSIWGGESGPKARPCDIQWIRDGVRQCRAAVVAAFVKQLGSFSIEEHGSQRFRTLWNDKKGGDISEWSDDLKVREFPKV